VCLHVILPNYSSHAIPSIFCLDKGGGVGFPDGFDETPEAVEAGVDVSGITCGAVFHGEAGVGGRDWLLRKKSGNHGLHREHGF